MPLTAKVLKELIDYGDNITKVVPSSLTYEAAQELIGDLISEDTSSYVSSPQAFSLTGWSTPTEAIPSVMAVSNSSSTDDPILFLIKPNTYARSLLLCNATTILGVIELESDIGGATMCSFGIDTSYFSTINVSTTRPVCTVGATFTSCVYQTSGGNYLCTDYEGEAVPVGIPVHLPSIVLKGE